MANNEENKILMSGLLFVVGIVIVFSVLFNLDKLFKGNEANEGNGCNLRAPNVDMTLEERVERAKKYNDPTWIKCTKHNH